MCCSSAQTLVTRHSLVIQHAYSTFCVLLRPLMNGSVIKANRYGSADTAEDTWRLTGPAQRAIDCLDLRFYNEGGSRIERPPCESYLVCSWAPRSQVPLHGHHGRLEGLCMPPIDAVHEVQEAKLFKQHGPEPIHTLKLHLQPVPTGLKTLSIARCQQQGRKACQLGKPARFELVLTDEYGIIIKEPARWFKIHDANVVVDANRHLTCHPVDGESWAQCFSLPETGLLLGTQQLKFMGHLQPCHWQQQLYATGEPFSVDFKFKIDVAAGRVTRLRVKPTPEVQRLGLLPLCVQAVDGDGNPTNDVTQGVILTAGCAALKTNLVQHKSRPGEWHGNLCMAVAPGAYSISISVADDSLSPGIELPGLHEVTVKAAPFVSSIKLDKRSSGMVAGALLEALVRLTIAPDATRNLPIETARQGLRLVAKYGDQQHEMAFCPDNQPGLRFKFTGNLPCTAGQACLEATWKETDPDLVAAFGRAEKNGQLDLEALSWKALTDICEFQVKPGEKEALQLFAAGRPKAESVCENILLGESLPLLEAQMADKHGNICDVEGDITRCSMRAKIFLHAGHDEPDLRAPVLASSDGQPEFEAQWNAQTSTFHLPLEATQLAHGQLGNKETVTAVYQLEVINGGPLHGLTGEFQFSYSDRRSQKEEQDEAKAAKASLSPRDKKLQKVRVSCDRCEA